MYFSSVDVLMIFTFVFVDYLLNVSELNYVHRNDKVRILFKKINKTNSAGLPIIYCFRIF